MSFMPPNLRELVDGTTSRMSFIRRNSSRKSKFRLDDRRKIVYEEIAPGESGKPTIVEYAGMGVDSRDYYGDFLDELAKETGLGVVLLYHPGLTNGDLYRGKADNMTLAQATKYLSEIYDGSQIIPSTHSLSTIFGQELVNPQFVKESGLEDIILPGIIKSPVTTMDDALNKGGKDERKIALGLSAPKIFDFLNRINDSNTSLTNLYDCDEEEAKGIGKALGYIATHVPMPTYPLRHSLIHNGNELTPGEKSVGARGIINPLTATSSLKNYNGPEEAKIQNTQYGNQGNNLRPTGIITEQDKVFSPESQESILKTLCFRFHNLPAGHRLFTNTSTGGELVKTYIDHVERIEEFYRR